MGLEGTIVGVICLNFDSMLLHRYLNACLALIFSSLLSVFWKREKMNLVDWSTNIFEILSRLVVSLPVSCAMRPGVGDFIWSTKYILSWLCSFLCIILIAPFVAPLYKSCLEVHEWWSHWDVCFVYSWWYHSLFWHFDYLSVLLRWAVYKFVM